MKSAYESEKESLFEVIATELLTFPLIGSCPAFECRVLSIIEIPDFLICSPLDETFERATLETKLQKNSILQNS